MLIGIDANEAILTANRVGINQYAFNLLHAMYQNPGGHDYVIYLKYPPLPDLPKPRKGWEYRVIPFPKLWTQTRLPFDLYFHKPRPDVFFSITHYAPRWSPIPTVIPVQDLGFLLFPEQFKAKDLNQLKSWTKYSIDNAAKLIAISENTKNDVVRFYHRSPKDITVVYHGFDPKLFRPSKNQKILDKYSIKKPYFVAVGALKPSKNIEGLIKAFSVFPHKEYSLVIVGKKAWMYNQVFSLVKTLGLENRVVFTGHAPDQEVPLLMSMASGLVLPSFYEGFALPALEAMACGTPVAISKVANIPEIAGDAVSYLDPNSTESICRAMEEIISKKRDKLIKAGFERTKLFKWENSAKQTIKVLEEAAKR